MKAKEAKKLADDTTSFKFRTEIEKVYAAIKKAAINHNLNLSYYVNDVNDTVVSLIVDQLKKDGYKAERKTTSGYMESGRYIKIDWSLPNE